MKTIKTGRLYKLLGLIGLMFFTVSLSAQTRYARLNVPLHQCYDNNPPHQPIQPLKSHAPLNNRLLNLPSILVIVHTRQTHFGLLEFL